MYKDGSYYWGFVVDNGSKGYYRGEKINTSYGYYYIDVFRGLSSDASGTVYTEGYYDKTTGKSYTPYYSGLGKSDGSSGLGSEYDYTYGAKGYQLFGYNGLYEAKQGGGSSNLYDYEFVYKDGSYYWGTVADNGSRGYIYSGDNLYTGYGWYYIYANAGSTSEKSGTVYTTGYYDNTTGKFYTPYYTSNGKSDGSSSLGSEEDYTYGTKGYQSFGHSGYYEAKQGGSSILYDYEFVYKDGSYYYGTVADDRSKGYYTGDKINTSYGYYYIYYTNAGSTSEKSGTVYTMGYYDKTTGKSYTPYYTSNGKTDGSSGLGSEYDYTYGAKGFLLFGGNGLYEARQGGGTTLYDYEFVYKDGSYYWGTVADNGSKGYYAGDKINNSYGYYYIYAYAGSTSEKSGTVYTTGYYDKTTGKTYTPYDTSMGKSDGISGLGSEEDYIYGTKPSFGNFFGDGGYLEAKLG